MATKPKSSTATATAADWFKLAQLLSERPRDPTYHELCDRFNAGERSAELAAAIQKT